MGSVIGTPIINEQDWVPNTKTGSFVISANKGVLIGMNTGIGLIGGDDRTFQITYQNEIVSPPAPVLTMLPPETYGTSVNLKWTTPADAANSGVDPSNLDHYIIQSSTDSNFSTNLATYTMNAIDYNPTTGYTISGLSNATTYYYRVYAVDKDQNPTNMNAWDLYTNLSGVRYSMTTRTKCITSIPPSGGQVQPLITNVIPGNYIIGEDCYYTANRNPQLAWTQNPGQTQVQLSITESYNWPTTIVEYPNLTVNSSDNQALANWNLLDGQYVVYARTYNNIGWSAWSPGKSVIVDTTIPIISNVSDNYDAENSKVFVKFTSSKPVSYQLYGGLSPDNLQLKGSLTDYVLNDQGNLFIPQIILTTGQHYYYQLVCADKVTNTVTSPIYVVGGGPGSNIVNTGNIGLESYWNYHNIDLGRAGLAQVNLNNGNLIVSANDFSLPGRGLPLAMTRYYNSLATYQGMLGPGWRSTWESFLQINSQNQNVTINDPDGSSHVFTYVSPSQFSRPPGDYRQVMKNGDGSYQVIEKTGTRYNYGVPMSGVAKLLSIGDRFGNLLTLSYTNGLLTSMTEPSGFRSAIFHYNSINFLSWIEFRPFNTDGTSRYVSYFYKNGMLNQVRYPYNGSSEIDVNYEYDQVMGLLNSTKVYRSTGGTEEPGTRKNETGFAYKSCSRSIDTVFSKNTTYAENFIDAGNPTLAIKYQFDYNGATTVFTDPKGQQYTYLHLAGGSCQSIQMPLVTNPTTYTYDADFNPTTVTRKKLIYNPANGTETLRDVITELIYDSNGNLRSVNVDKGYQNLLTTLTYEPLAHNYVTTDLASVTDPKGNLTKYINNYDSSDKPTSLTINPTDDYFIVQTFDPYGQRVSKDVNLNDATIPNNFSLAVNKYHFDYGYQNGLLTTLKNAYGITNYNYTIYGERNSVTDANGVRQDYGIDPLTGDMTSVPAPVAVGQNDLLPFTLPGLRYLYTYDVNGNKETAYDALNHNTNYYYDPLNNLRRVESPSIPGLNRYNSYNRYDENGNLLQTMDYNNVYTTYEYDLLNRKIKTKDFAGNIQEELVYDEASRVKLRYDEKRNKTEYFYDSVDNLLCSKFYEATVLRCVSTFTYDNNGNLLSKTVPISATDESGTIVSDYQYDAANRPISIVTSCATNSNYNQSVNYSYEAGQLKTMTVSVSGGNPQTYNYTYDTAQRIDTLVNPSGQKVKFDYYPGGQRKQKSVYLQSTDSSPFMTVGYQYDTAYRLKNLNYQWGGSYYAKLGYTYNEIDKITENLVQYHVNAPAVTDFLLNQFPPNSGNYTRPTVSPLFDGSYTNRYTYDDLGRMTYSEIYGISPLLQQDGAHQLSRKTWYNQVDANGNPREKVTQNLGGTPVEDPTTETNTFDYLNRLSSQIISGTDGYQMTPTYDANGNLISESYNDGRPSNSTYQYGIDSQLLQSYSETKHKQKEKWNGTSNEYIDSYNRTSKIYTYELNGKLLRMRTNIYDSNNPYDIWSKNDDEYFYYSHDGAVADQINGTVRNFTRLGRELICNNYDGGSYFYIQNLRGDVMMLVGSDGNASSIRDYDASGQMLSQAPRDRDPFGFTGGLDAGNGLWKLGARFYDSSKNSFIQQDRYMGDPKDPLSLNRYAYCGMDPVNYVDPTGFNAEALTWGLTALEGAAVTISMCTGVGEVALVVAAGVATGVVAAEIIHEATRDKMHPDPAAQGNPHSVYKRDPVTGKIKKYQTYKPQTNPNNPNPTETEKRYDGDGESHYNKETGEDVNTPHVHDPSTPGGVREPTSDEVPN